MKMVLSALIIFGYASTAMASEILFPFFKCGDYILEDDSSASAFYILNEGHIYNAVSAYRSDLSDEGTGVDNVKDVTDFRAILPKGFITITQTVISYPHRDRDISNTATAVVEIDGQTMVLTCE